MAAAGKRLVAHVDMDAFYASVEVRDNPGLQGLPVVVGGAPDKRGVVAAASYEARKYGIHSAMPSRTAARLCPGLVFVPARHQHYARVSQRIREILGRYTPVIEPLALDEAFLDLTASRRLWGDAETIGRRIKSEISGELGLTASVGIGPNKFIAKLASDLDKPDGMVAVAADGVRTLLDPLPVRRIWGVGKSGEGRLARHGILTIGDLRLQPPAELENRFGAWGKHISHLARGMDDRPVVTDWEARSLSHETTFERDIEDFEVLAAVLLDLVEQVGTRLRRLGRRAGTINLKVRYGDFTTVTRARTPDEPTDITGEIWRAARGLLAATIEARPEPVRLLGAGVSSLEAPGAEQADLFDHSRGRQRAIDSVADDVNRKFGSRVLHRGLRRR